jgi:hypothetical protein
MLTVDSHLPDACQGPGQNPEKLAFASRTSKLSLESQAYINVSGIGVVETVIFKDELVNLPCEFRP